MVRLGAAEISVNAPDSHVWLLDTLTDRSEMVRLIGGDACVGRDTCTQVMNV